MLWSFVFFIVIVTRSGNAVEIHCKFSQDFDWFTVGKVYTCSVQQKLDALHSDSEVIQVFGDHHPKKQNKDVLAIRIHSRNVYYFSSGYEKFFTNLQVIQVYSSKLKFITQKDLMPFTKLKHIDLNKNDLEVLEKDLFKYNTELEVIKVSDNKLRFIDVTAFEGLFKLHTLELTGNHCIWKSTPKNDDLDEDEEISREDAINVMYEARTRCYRDYILKELFDMEMGRNLRERSVIVTKLESRIEDLIRQNDLFYDRMRQYKDELDQCQSKEINKVEMTEEMMTMMMQANGNSSIKNSLPEKPPTFSKELQPPKEYGIQKYPENPPYQNSKFPENLPNQNGSHRQNSISNTNQRPNHDQSRQIHSNNFRQQNQDQNYFRKNQIQTSPTRNDRRNGNSNSRWDSWEREGRSTHEYDYQWNY
ncbi:hypothetical protein PVAND_015630 [Polypedilum vanderplanki]|uniref:Uncharacterized protein n=1 Tax=Polypedilum vanderplanki TaxID=319348 RepID=A0A9J6BDJ4_POLVA|nr:hypothetical protein PVAND_015630 [Polypedilum vanderplanki]